MATWKLVTNNEPYTEDLPVTIVKSLSRDRMVWSKLLAELTDQDKLDAGVFFEDGEILTSEEWYPKVS